MKIELLDGDFIEIDESKRIGVGFSVGVDSTLLLYIMLKHCTETVYAFTITVNNRYHRHMQVASDVLVKCCKAIGNFNVIHSMIHCDDIDLSTTQNEPALKQNRFIKGGLINQLYIGTNELPPHGHIHTEDYKVNHQQEYIRREPGVIKSTNSYNGIFQYPFINYNKKEDKTAIRKI